MKRDFVLSILMLTLSGPFWAPAQQVAKPETFNQQLSYAYGIQAAKSFQEQQIPIDVKQFIHGFVTQSQGQSPVLSEQEIWEVFKEFEKRLAERHASPEDKKWLEAGYQYLTTQSKKLDVSQTPSGLLYQVVKAGDQTTKPKLTDKVTVSYKGTLFDGTVFDDSKGKAVAFPLDKVIRGWQEGLQLMSVGSEYRFIVPHYLAYRDSDSNEKIRPYSTLVFDVTLLAVN